MRCGGWTDEPVATGETTPTGGCPGEPACRRQDGTVLGGGVLIELPSRTGPRPFCSPRGAPGATGTRCRRLSRGAIQRPLKPPESITVLDATRKSALKIGRAHV